MRFSSSAGHTVGIEWELQLLDHITLDLSNGIVPLMEFFPEATFVKPEFIQSCVELNSSVSQSTDEAVQHIAHSLDALLRRCDELGMRVCGGGTHPFCRRLALITPMPRYQKLEASSGYLAHSQITFSTHVHVGMDDGDQAMLAMHRLARVTPAFLALSANSPFWRGHETGHAAYRHRILAATPNYGLPTVFDSWRGFNEFFDAARRAGMAQHFKDIHWDIRPHPDFGTLELRVMDSASDLSTVHGLAAFARCLAVAFAEAGEAEAAAVLPGDLPYWVQKQNRFTAGHRGLDADFILEADGTHRPLRDLVDDLVEFAAPTAERLGETAGLSTARALLSRPTAYDRQVDAYREANSTRAVVEMLKRRLLESAREAGASYEKAGAST